jgi:hypothetical protein
MRLLAAMVLSLAAFAAEAEQMWITVLGPQNVNVRRNIQEYGPAAVLPNLTALNVTMSADDWPNSQQVTIVIEASFDGGATWPHSTSVVTARPGVEKDGSQLPVQIGIGWNEAVRQATHVRAISNNPGPGFTSTVLIQGLTAF